MNIVDKLMKYVETRNPHALGIDFEIDTGDLFSIVIEILSWLKLERKREIWIKQGRPTRLKPMELDLSIQWYRDLAELTLKETVFAEIFEVDGHYLQFKKDISDEYVHEARRLAYEKYNPIMIIN